MLCTNGVAERGFHLLPLSTLSGGCTLEDLQDVPHVQLRGHGPVNLPCLCATTMGTRKSGRRMEWEHSALIGTSWHRQERTVFCFPRNMKREARPEIYEAAYAPLASGTGAPCAHACGAGQRTGAA